MSRSRLRHFLQDPLEAGLAWGLYGLLRALPLDIASGLGGGLARAVGPWLPVHRVAERNLDIAFPDMPAPERRRVLRDAWDNLGRTLFEYPHLTQIMAERVEIIGGEHLAAFRDDGRPGIAFSGHLANWEILPAAAGVAGVPLTNVYRAPNNAKIDAIIRHARRLSGPHLVPKGAPGARILLKALKSGAHLGLLVDQKMNDGISVPFFGEAAMTASALADLALRFKTPLLAAQPIRLTGARFRLIISPLIEPETLADGQTGLSAQQAFMGAVNRQLEAWIRANPAQWLWFHRRWPKS